MESVSRNREPEREQPGQVDPSEAIKTYLKSGVHKNDPKKIAEMIKRMKAGKAASGPAPANGNRGGEGDAAAKSIFEKYGGGGKKKKKGGWRPAAAAAREPDEYEEEEDEEEADGGAAKKTFELKTWRPDSSYPGGGRDRQGASDLFRKFASKNAGGSFRDGFQC